MSSPVWNRRRDRQRLRLALRKLAKHGWTIHWSGPSHHTHVHMIESPDLAVTP